MIRITAKTVATRPFSLAADDRPYVSAIGGCTAIFAAAKHIPHRDVNSRNRRPITRLKKAGYVSVPARISMNQRANSG